MSATVFLEETLTRHTIYTERYAGGVHNRLRPLLSELSKDIRELLNDQMTTFEASRRRAVSAQIRALITGIMDQYDTQFLQEMYEFADYEAGFNVTATQQVVSVQLAAIAPERIEAMVSNNEFRLVSGKKVETYTIQSMLDNFRDAIGDESDTQIRRIINAGIANGDNAEVITRRIARKVSASINSGKVAQWAKTNTLTATKAVSQAAMNETVKANRSLFTREKWSSVLDSRVSLVCLGRDSNIYKIGVGPYPPAHYRCRSVRLPFIEPEDAIVKESTRASQFGPVDSRTTTSSFMRRQSVEFQNDALGPERAQLFREGKVKLDGFTDDTGRTYTLTELRAKEGLTLG